MTTPHSASPDSEVAASEVREEETARMSTARGQVSVVLAVGSPLVFLLTFLAAFALMRFGLSDADYWAILRVIGVVFALLASAMVIAAVILGVMSIIRAGRHTTRPGRAAAIALGWIGASFGTLLGVFYLWLLINSLMNSTS